MRQLNINTQGYRFMLSPSSLTLVVESGIALVIATLSMILAALSLGYGTVPIEIPSGYTGDALSAGMLFKGILENGWYLNNPNAGAPFGLDWGPYSMVEGSHFLLIRFICFFTDSYGTALTSFFLISFATAAISAYAVMRCVGLNRLFSCCGAFLFTLQVYHFLRGAHIFLASYYSVPIFVGFAFLVFSRSRSKLISAKTLGIAILLIIAASGGVYYAFFGCMLIAFAGIAASLEQKTLRPLVVGSLMITAVSLSVLANLAPHISYARSHSEDSNISTRNPIDSEILGLKLTQMLLPSPIHRQPQLKSLTSSYSTTAPLVNENMASSLGFLGALGLIVSFFALLLNLERVGGTTLYRVGAFNLVAFLYATTGGFGVLFSLAITAQIRGLNRISILIAFLSLTALFLALQRILAKIGSPGLRNILIGLASLALGAFGFWDQTPGWQPSIAEANQVTWRKDAEVGSAIMKLLPTGARVYQLPYIEFPESPPKAIEGPYGLARRYLQTRSISWSYGAMKGSVADQWIKAAETLPLEQRLGMLAGSGFDAVMIERLAYTDSGAGIEPTIRSIAGAPLFECADGSCALYSLKKERSKSTLPLLLAIRGNGWSIWETDSDGGQFVWSIGDRGSRLLLLNPLTTPVDARLRFSIAPRKAATLEARSESKGIKSWVLQAGEAGEFDSRIEIAPGVSTIDITSTISAERASVSDSRRLGFQLRGLKLESF